MVTNDPPTADSATSNWYRWIFGQPAYVVLLFALMAAIAYGTWYGLPAALTQIQKGYEVQDSAHREERKEIRGESKEIREEAKQEKNEFREAIGRIHEKVTEAIDKNTDALDHFSDRLEKSQK